MVEKNNDTYHIFYLYKKTNIPSTPVYLLKNHRIRKVKCLSKSKLFWNTA
jgi:hypothetical protein